MNVHPITTPASPSPESPLVDASFDSIESLTTTFTASVVPTLETTTVTEVALGYHRNQQYSITAMTTSTGAVAERYAYTAYGQPTICNASASPIGNQQSQIANRFTYTGREWDETLGHHHFRARWMSPLAGRFLGRDPIGYAVEHSLYEYCANKPLNYLDPSGEIKIWCACKCGWSYGQENTTVMNATIECNGNAERCCRRACRNLVFEREEIEYKTVPDPDAPLLSLHCLFYGRTKLEPTIVKKRIPRYFYSGWSTVGPTDPDPEFAPCDEWDQSLSRCLQNCSDISASCEGFCLSGCGYLKVINGVAFGECITLCTAACVSGGVGCYGYCRGACKKS